MAALAATRNLAAPRRARQEPFMYPPTLSGCCAYTTKDAAPHSPVGFFLTNLRRNSFIIHYGAARCQWPPAAQPPRPRAGSARMPLGWGGAVIIAWGRERQPC